MDFLNKTVIHKTFGEGVVCKHQHPYFDVQFGDQIKRFSFPNAFAGFLRFANVEDQTAIEQMLQEAEAQKQAELAKQARRYASPAPAPIMRTRQIAPKSPRKAERPNIVFKCNYCDGGNNESHIGYMGPCSDSIIRYNIDVAQHTWCGDPDCPCRQYLDGEIDVFQLEQLFLDGYLICYESKMLIDWTAFAGTILKGDRKDEPKKIRNIHLNSLAVLTTREPHVPEKGRIVFGVFLVGDADEGDNRETGFVKCTSKYHIDLSPDEASKIKFWDYHANDTNPETPSWGQGLYRYTSDIEATQILQAIVDVKQAPSEKAFAKEFLNHFCKINGIDINAIPQPNGALYR